MNLTEALFTRKSVRKYIMKEMDPFVLEDIERHKKMLQPLKSDIDVDIYVHDNINSSFKLNGIFLVEAPYYLILSSELKEDYLLNAGFIMQQMVLYLTANDIGTCYQGGFRPNQYIKDKLKHEYVIAVAFGKTIKSIKRDPNKAKRLDEKLLAAFKEDAGVGVKKLIKAGCIAPSSMNHQPWRMMVYRSRIHVFCKKGFFDRNVISDRKLIDIGIMFANMAVMADEEWINIDISDLDYIKERQFKNVEYISSILVKDEGKAMLDNNLYNIVSKTPTAVDISETKSTTNYQAVPKDV